MLLDTVGIITESYSESTGYQLSLELTDRVHDVVTNIWGDETSEDIRQIDTEPLVAMHGRVSRAVQISYDDDNIDSLGTLLPLEEKIVCVLQERL